MWVWLHVNNIFVYRTNKQNKKTWNKQTWNKHGRGTQYEQTEDIFFKVVR